MKPWVKLYTEINRDPKIITLSWAQRGIWSALLAMAGEIDERDGEDSETGKLDTIEYTALRIRCDLEMFTQELSTLLSRGTIEDRDGILYIHNYAKRQEVPPSQKRPAMRERQREHRLSQAEPTRDESMSRNVTSMSRNVTPPESDTDIELDTESDADSAPPPVVQPRQSTRVREPYPNNPAIQAFQDVFKCRPKNREQAEVITNTIKPSELDKWKQVMQAWHLRDYKPQNIPGMLDWYLHGIPVNGHGKQARAAPPDPVIDVAEAIRLNELGRMQIP